jgi:16S rRNA (guanine527-N7)-methyltransferase
LDNDQQQAIIEFQSQLISWNKTHNLISKNQAKNIKEHIDDSLLVGPHLSNDVIDLGSGGGLPGIPLAIVYPEKNIYLVESNTKKSSFLLNATSRLNLGNTTVINKRLEEIDPADFPKSYDIVCRAVGSSSSIIEISKKHLEHGDVRLRLMKTLEQFDEEIIPDDYKVKEINKFPSKAKDKTHILVTIELER